MATLEDIFPELIDEFQSQDKSLHGIMTVMGVEMEKMEKRMRIENESLKTKVDEQQLALKNSCHQISVLSRKCDENEAKLLSMKNSEKMRTESLQHVTKQVLDMCDSIRQENIQQSEEKIKSVQNTLDLSVKSLEDKYTYIAKVKNECRDLERRISMNEQNTSDLRMGLDWMAKSIADDGFTVEKSNDEEDYYDNIDDGDEHSEDEYFDKDEHSDDTPENYKELEIPIPDTGIHMYEALSAKPNLHQGNEPLPVNMNQNLESNSSQLYSASSEVSYTAKDDNQVFPNENTAISNNFETINNQYDIVPVRDDNFAQGDSLDTFQSKRNETINFQDEKNIEIDVQASNLSEKTDINILNTSDKSYGVCTTDKMNRDVSDNLKSYNDDILNYQSEDQNSLENIGEGHIIGGNNTDDQAISLKNLGGNNTDDEASTSKNLSRNEIVMKGDGNKSTDDQILDDGTIASKNQRNNETHSVGEECSIGFNKTDVKNTNPEVQSNHQKDIVDNFKQSEYCNNDEKCISKPQTNDMTSMNENSAKTADNSKYEDENISKSQSNDQIDVVDKDKISVDKNISINNESNDKTSMSNDVAKSINRDNSYEENISLTPLSNDQESGIDDGAKPIDCNTISDKENISSKNECNDPIDLGDDSGISIDGKNSIDDKINSKPQSDVETSMKDDGTTDVGGNNSDKFGLDIQNNNHVDLEYIDDKSNNDRNCNDDKITLKKQSNDETTMNQNSARSIDSSHSDDENLISKNYSNGETHTLENSDISIDRSNFNVDNIIPKTQNDGETCMMDIGDNENNAGILRNNSEINLGGNTEIAIACNDSRDEKIFPKGQSNDNFIDCNNSDDENTQINDETRPIKNIDNSIDSNNLDENISLKEQSNKSIEVSDKSIKCNNTSENSTGSKNQNHIESADNDKDAVSTNDSNFEVSTSSKPSITGTSDVKNQLEVSTPPDKTVDDFSDFDRVEDQPSLSLTTNNRPSPTAEIETTPCKDKKGKENPQDSYIHRKTVHDGNLEEGVKRNIEHTNRTSAITEKAKQNLDEKEKKHDVNANSLPVNENSYQVESEIHDRKILSNSINTKNYQSPSSLQTKTFPEKESSVQSKSDIANVRPSRRMTDDPVVSIPSFQKNINEAMPRQSSQHGIKTTKRKLRRSSISCSTRKGSLIESNLATMNEHKRKIGRQKLPPDQLWRWAQNHVLTMKRLNRGMTNPLLSMGKQAKSLGTRVKELEEYIDGLHSQLKDQNTYFHEHTAELESKVKELIKNSKPPKDTIEPKIKTQICDMSKRIDGVQGELQVQSDILQNSVKNVPSRSEFSETLENKITEQSEKIRNELVENYEKRVDTHERLTIIDSKCTVMFEHCLQNGKESEVLLRKTFEEAMDNAETKSELVIAEIWETLYFILQALGCSSGKVAEDKLNHSTIITSHALFKKLTSINEDVNDELSKFTECGKNTDVYFKRVCRAIKELGNVEYSSTEWFKALHENVLESTKLLKAIQSNPDKKYNEYSHTIKKLIILQEAFFLGVSTEQTFIQLREHLKNDSDRLIEFEKQLQSQSFHINGITTINSNMSLISDKIDYVRNEIQCMVQDKDLRKVVDRFTELNENEKKAVTTAIDNLSTTSLQGDMGLDKKIESLHTTLQTKAGLNSLNQCHSSLQHQIQDVANQSSCDHLAHEIHLLARKVKQKLNVEEVHRMLHAELKKKEKDQSIEDGNKVVCLSCQSIINEKDTQNPLKAPAKQSTKVNSGFSVSTHRHINKHMLTQTQRNTSKN